MPRRAWRFTDADRFTTLIETDTVRTASFRKPSSYAAALRCLGNNAWHRGYLRNWNPTMLTSSARTTHTDISRRRYERLPPAKSSLSVAFQIAPGRLVEHFARGHGRRTGSLHEPASDPLEHDRCITVREMARLHGFPDWFRFHATKWHGARQSVTPGAPSRPRNRRGSRQSPWV